MTEWKPRRFWTSVGLRAADGGWQVALDDRIVNTPGKLPLVLPTRALAQAVAGVADGCVVGSAIVKLIGEGRQVPEVLDFVGSLAGAAHRA